MAHSKNTVFYTTTVKQSVPLNSNGTGTITTAGKAVVGVGTLFKTEMPAGSWLVSESQDQVRQVIRVDSDTEAYIQEAFSSDLGSAAPSIIHSEDAKCVSIAVSNPSGGAAGEIDGYVFAAGSSVAWSKDSRTTSSIRDLVDPIIVDASGTTFQILIQY